MGYTSSGMLVLYYVGKQPVFSPIFSFGAWCVRASLASMSWNYYKQPKAPAEPPANLAYLTKLAYVSLDRFFSIFSLWLATSPSVFFVVSYFVACSCLVRSLAK